MPSHKQDSPLQEPSKSDDVQSPSPVSITDDANALRVVLPNDERLEQLAEKAFHWEVSDWNALDARTFSRTFHCGDFPWRILLYPKGNNQHDFLSVYLEVPDPTSHGLSEGWSVCAAFALAISNTKQPTHYFTNHAHHRFTGEEVDWGFTRFYDLKNLTKAHAGKCPLVLNGHTRLSVFVRIVRDETGVLWHNLNNYDSRKETGYVGIKNQGATCYMNSLLQSLYCTNSFRKAVYQIPTESEDPTKSVALALQRCFYNLQYSNEPVGTTELTKSFGWDSLGAFMQHDVQEFNRVLQDNLESKMKNTPAGGVIKNLFVGRMKSFIACINVDYESSCTEDFYDIQLNVKGCADLQASFREYVAVETLEGDNRYMAEGYGLQDARKGVVFQSFPPVLHLQLKRFEYDMRRDTMVKINDRCEFPERLNLDAFVEEAAEECDYVLHGVLVHSGDLEGGHYFALIKPEKDGNWLRFDDDRVTPVTRREVFEDNFGDCPLREGGDHDQPKTRTTMPNRSVKGFTNAYMLVYIRESKLEEVLAPLAENEIPRHLSVPGRKDLIWRNVERMERRCALM